MKLDKEDHIILTGISLVILLTHIFGGWDDGGGKVDSSGGDFGGTRISIIEAPSKIIPTVVPTVVVVPKPTPKVLFDIDRDTNALLYQKGNCTILIKDYTELGRKDAEIGNCTFEDWEDFKKKIPNIYPKPTVVPTVVAPTSVPARQLTITELENIFYNLNEKGWNQLYELNEFDCSRMSSYWQIYFEKEGIRSYIVRSDIRRHAWVAVRVADFSGEKDSSAIWTDNDGVEWYYIEATVPKVVEYYDAPFYNVKDREKLGTYEQAVIYNFIDYKLTADDIQKVTNFYNQ